jgi:hypothetical protein
VYSHVHQCNRMLEYNNVRTFVSVHISSLAKYLSQRKVFRTELKRALCVQFSFAVKLGISELAGIRVYSVINSNHFNFRSEYIVTVYSGTLMLIEIHSVHNFDCQFKYQYQCTDQGVEIA